MADARVVSVKLEQIEEYHAELQEKRRELSRELTDTTQQRAVERMFENVIQASADLAQHVATRDFEYTDETATGAIRVLGRESAIDSETMETLISAVGFRNVLAHEYGQIDYARVYQILQDGLDVFDDFSQQIARWFRNTG